MINDEQLDALRHRLAMQAYGDAPAAGPAIATFVSFLRECDRLSGGRTTPEMARSLDVADE